MPKRHQFTVAFISHSVIILDIYPFIRSPAQNLAFGANTTSTAEKDPKPLAAADQKTKIRTSKATGKYVLIAHVNTHIDSTIIIIPIAITITNTNS